MVMLTPYFAIKNESRRRIEHRARYDLIQKVGNRFLTLRR